MRSSTCIPKGNTLFTSWDFPWIPIHRWYGSKLETPRLNSPRIEVMQGSVAIGGKQTGIYPITSPVAGILLAEHRSFFLIGTKYLTLFYRWEQEFNSMLFLIKSLANIKVHCFEFDCNQTWLPRPCARSW